MLALIACALVSAEPFYCVLLPTERMVAGKWVYLVAPDLGPDVYHEAGCAREELSSLTVEHEAEPGVAVDPRDAIGRWATLRTDGWRPTLLTLRGGLPPRRYRELVACAGPPSAADRELVARGLGSPNYATRKAAQRILEGRGEAAIPALAWGSRRADDFEVRERCRAALDVVSRGRGG